MSDMRRHHARGKARPEFPPEPIDRVAAPLRRFLHTEAAGGAVLLIAAAVALIVANTGWGSAFDAFWKTRVGLHFERPIWDRPLREWINDGLMTLFFFVVGLELKREIAGGELRSAKRAALPIIAAIGGMVVPAALYLMLARNAQALRGWGAVMTTDTGFVIGCLALLGRRIPDSLRTFVLAVAIIDDVGAMLVITLGYGHGFETGAFIAALAGFAVTLMMRGLGVRPLPAYWVAGVYTWAALHESGIPATITGVILALLTPSKPWVDEARLSRFLRWARRRRPRRSARHAADTPNAVRRALARAARESLSPLERLQERLHPWSSFGVLPLFALANAGVSIGRVGDFRHITLLTAIGLTIGKPIGVAGFAWIAAALRIAAKPAGISWPMLLAAGTLAGMGFSMALYIAQLAFSGGALASAKLGILIASLVSGMAGLILLWTVTARRS